MVIVAGSESDDEMRDAGGQKRGLSEATNEEEEDSSQPSQALAQRDHESAAQNNEMLFQDV